jgi:amino acid transporter
LVAIVVVATAFLVNVRGARSVGRSATISFLLLVAPILAFVAVVFTRTGAATTAWSRIATGIRGPHNSPLLAVGLATVLWNYSGWDNVGTFAEEVEDPQRNYPRALGLTSPLIAGIYLVSLLAGIAVTSDPGAWNESAGWPTIARAAGGPLLGALLAGAALVSAWSLFNGQLLSVSRVPYVMARDGWLPSVLARVSSRMIPTDSLLASCLIAAALAAFTFENLIVLDVLLYAASVIVELLALIGLRWKDPDAMRPFRIPGGWPVLTLVVGAPAACTAALVLALLRSGSARIDFLVAVAAMGSGIVLYYARSTTRGTSAPTRAA